MPLNWACTNCGYRVEGELPEECGEGREVYVTPNATPVPTLTLTVTPLDAASVEVIQLAP